jgi:acyl-coenzyme A synthetase/AMP-(fatty) acid ligase/aryl carrier-like protein
MELPLLTGVFKWPRQPMIDDFSRTSVPHIVDMLAKKNITIVFLPTALGEVLVNVDWPDDAPLRILACAGEKMMRRPDRPTPFEFLNLYGPTENTVIASYAAVTSGTGWTPPPIGRPVGNVRLYVLDNFMNPVATGVFGELYIGGKGVARGYLNRARLTAEKFVPDPFGDEPGARLYRTGDLVKYLPDGNIDFAARIDNQIKLRGFRIELEEIEKLLYANTGIKEAAVVLKETAESEKYIEAFIVLNAGCTLSRNDLKEFLREKLPAFMVPSSVVFQKELPKSASGKIDKRLLAGLRTGTDRQSDVLRPAETEMEKLLGKLWAEFLKVDELDVQDNFFDMGGHSLMMAQVHYRLRERFNAEISLIDLFRYPTIRSLAKFMETREKSQPSLTIS